MNCKNLLVSIAIVLILYICFRKPLKIEKFREIFGGAGYKTPVLEVNIDYENGKVPDGFTLNVDEPIGADDVSMCVVKTSELIKDQTGLCSTAI